jgi:hypothetical protein
MKPPVPEFASPPGSEARWPDQLAVLITADPALMTRRSGLPESALSAWEPCGRYQGPAPRVRSPWPALSGGQGARLSWAGPVSGPGAAGEPDVLTPYVPKRVPGAGGRPNVGSG